MNTGRTCALFAALSLLAGCAEPDCKTYRVTVTRPDGAVHRQFTLRSASYPYVMPIRNESSCLAVYYCTGFGCATTEAFPSGWMLDVEPTAESGE
jgi:hypothetical protein